MNALGSEKWEKHLDKCSDESAKYKWHPFPEHYVDMRSIFEKNVRQIPIQPAKIQVIAKISDNLEMLQHYGVNDSSMTPKVLCWNDISPLTLKMASKALKAGIENAYKEISPNMKISFQSVSAGNHDPLPFSDGDPSDLLIYHVIDPTQRQQLNKPKLNKAKGAIPTSLSTSSLSGYASSKVRKVKPASSSSNETPIQFDTATLKELAEQIENEKTAFIFDCSYASRALDSIKIPGKQFFGFAASKGPIVYTSKFPCDLFTSCLLTPSKVALLWQSQKYSDFATGLLAEIDIHTLIEMIADSPESDNILHMLDKALDAIADRIVSETMYGSTALFDKLFRVEPVITRLFHNYMFATRVLDSISMTPECYPALPDMSQHSLWDVFDLHVDRALSSLRESLKPKPNTRLMFTYHDMLEESLRRLESWLAYPKKDRRFPRELSFLPMLIQEKDFFVRAIKFAAGFLEISDDTTIEFLRTRTFPLLPEKFDNADEYDPETIAAMSFVVSDSILMSPPLCSFFQNSISFWIDRMHTEHTEILESCLSCLLGLLDNNAKLDMYKESGLPEILQDLLKNESAHVRCLSHLLLSAMKVPLQPPYDVIGEEPDALCRSAMVSRITVTFKELQNTALREELFFDLVCFMNDVSSTVRQEAIVCISELLSVEPKKFTEQLVNFISDHDESKPDLPTMVPLLAKALEVALYDPSITGGERLAEFFLFLKTRISDAPSNPLGSRFKKSCLKKLAYHPAPYAMPQETNTEAMVIPDVTFTGKPDISPSGLLACPSTKGYLYYQPALYKKHIPFCSDYFITKFNPGAIDAEFSPLARTSSITPEIVYTRFLDDNRILSATSRSQVVVIDSRIVEDAVCSFCMSDPTTYHNSIVDYNNHSFHLLHTDGRKCVSIFDLELQKKVTEVILPQTAAPYSLQWLRYYSSLYYITDGPEMRIYDTRMKRPVTEIEIRRDFVGCNVSSTLPLYMVMGSARGNISMIDMRQMSIIASHTHKDIKQFDVHKHLPFACAISGNSLVSFSYEKGEFVPQVQQQISSPQAFTMHHSESSCALRCSGRVQCFDILY